MHSFHICRYDPGADEKPRMQVIELEVGNAVRMLLDVLTRLKAIDPNSSSRGADPQRRGHCRQGGADRTLTPGRVTRWDMLRRYP